MITINTIKKIEESKRKIKKEIYTKIFEQFSRKIQISVHAGQKQTFVEVPVFLLGYPSYNIENAAVYLKRQLELSGFRVIAVSASGFNVSWFTQRRKHQEEPPPFELPAPQFSEDQFPSLINLKKAAKRYSA
jgi:hypothetical protein